MVGAIIRAVLFGIGIGGMLVPGFSTGAEPGFEFHPNPPSQRYDYYSSQPDAQHQLKLVEKYHWERALKGLKRGNYQQAHNNLDFILRYIPNHPKALERYSQLAIKRGKPKSALRYLDFAVRFNPETASTYIVYGIHRYRMQEYAKASQRFRQALKHEPKNAEAHYDLGLALLKQNKLSQARKHARKAYALNYPLPGLKKQLQHRGYWQESDNKASDQNIDSLPKTR